MTRPDKIYEIKHTLKEAPLAPAEEIVYEELVRIKLKEKPKLSDFHDYSELEIKRDEAEVAKIKESFQKEVTQRSEILEAILFQQIELSWFGDEAYTFQTTDYDDFKNHTDFVIEIDDINGKTLKMAIDVTIGNNIEKNTKKFEKIKKDLDIGRGTTIKYFQSEINAEISGQQINLPSYIIAMAEDELTKLCDIVANTIGNNKTKENMKILSYNPLQLSIIQNLIDQTETQMKYLEKNGNTNTNIFRNLKNVKDKLNEILEKKIEILKKENEILEKKKGRIDQKNQHAAPNVIKLESPF